MTTDDQAELRTKIDTIRRATGERLKVVYGDRAAVVVVLEQFIDELYPLTHSPSAMWDHFSVTAHKCGLDATQQDRVTRIFSTVAHGRWATRPYPADWPWFELPEG